MRFFKFLLPILVLAVGAGTFYFFKSSKSKPVAISTTPTKPVVSAQLIELQAAAPNLTLFGQIEAPNNSVLSAAITSEVLQVYALEGLSVEKGDILIDLEDTDAALEILQKEAEVAEIEAQKESDKNRFEADKSLLQRERALLALARKAVERAKALAKSNAGTEATLDSALQQEQLQLLAITQRNQAIDDFALRQKQWTARLNRAQAALKRANRDLEKTKVIAPFSGRIVEVMTSPGDRTSPGSNLIKLYDDSQLEVRSQVPSRYVNTLQKVLSNSATLTAELTDNGQSIPLQLHRLSANVSQGQGGVDAFFRANQPLPTPGKTVEVKLNLPPLENVAVISTDALYGADRVYLIKDNQLQAISVSRLGQQVNAQGHQLLIVDGDVFSDGDMILNSRLPQAIDGLPVEVQQSESITPIQQVEEQ